VLLETDDDLDLGEFGIATRMVQPERGRGETAPRIPATSGQTMVYKPAGPGVPTEAASPVELGIEPPRATLTVNGRTHELDGRRVVIGRSKECDIQIADPNASRRHAELRREGDAYWLVDLGSTNGLDVNGKRTQRAKLANGDRVTIGTTELVFKTAL
jgi:pSer/pThr/pTyr-binding forkhead associated (FHA) protein